MNGRRLAAVLAAVIALATMPGAVQAGKPNELFNASVSPTSGTTATIFTFSVRYRSDKDFNATSVVALAAGRAVPLRLVAGSASDGTFSGTAKLPDGKWRVTFEAQGAKGPNIRLVGPSLVISAPPPRPSRAPKATMAPAPAPPTPRPTPRPAKTASAASASPRVVPPASSSERASPAADGTASGTARPSSLSPSSSQTDQASGTQGGGNAIPPDAGNGGPPLVWFGLVALLLLSAGVFVALARRRPEGQVPPSGDQPSIPTARPPVNAHHSGVVEETEDPILAAMGLGHRATQASPVEAPITISVRFGRGERPPPRRNS
jgi:hypothetical protein